MKILDAIEIIINYKNKKAISKDYNNFIYWCADTNTLCWNDGRYVTLTTSVLNSDWLIQDISEQEKEDFEIVKYINNYLGSNYESIDDINVIDILENYKSNLSEEFIERLLPIVDDDYIWFDIFEYQKLSENFIPSSLLMLTYIVHMFAVAAAISRPVIGINAVAAAILA